MTEENKPTGTKPPLLSSRPITSGYGGGMMSADIIEFLEYYQPFIKDKSGQIVAGNIPPEILTNNWHKLSHHMSLGNFKEKDKRALYHQNYKIDMLSLAEKDDESFTIHDMITQDRVNMLRTAQTTKSSDGYERKMLNTNIVSQESRTHFTETQTPQAKNYGTLDPRKYIKGLI